MNKGGAKKGYNCEDSTQYKGKYDLNLWRRLSIIGLVDRRQTKNSNGKPDWPVEVSCSKETQKFLPVKVEITENAVISDWIYSLIDFFPEN